MKSILQSIKPQYCELIASGKKTIEVRKTRPKLDVPFKVYIYCTKDKTSFLLPTYSKGNLTDSDIWQKGNGKVIGEYVCDDIEEYKFTYLHEPPFQNIKGYSINDDELKQICLTYEALNEYGKDKPLYLWHISDLKIYDKPKELSEFVKYGFEQDYAEWEHYSIAGVNGKEPDIDDYRLISPPQSWCYVEE